MKAAAHRTLPHVVHHVRGDTLLASAGQLLLESQDSGRSWKKICRVPGSVPGRLMAGTRLGRRLFRRGIHHVARPDEHTIVIIADRTIHKYDGQRGRFVAASPLVGSRPLALCDAGQGRLYYGEYRGNPERSAVHVMASEDLGATWQPVHRMEGARHIHGVYFDPYEDALWITTGDEDQEAGLWRSRDRLATVERVAHGGQQVRAVQLVFTQNHVYFGSDTPREQNHIYRWHRDTGVREALQAVEGSVFYGCKVGDRLFFSTVCEPSVVNIERVAAVWTTRDGSSWSTLARFSKDRWPMKLFQYGQVLFPSGTMSEERLWMTPFATRGDQRSVRVELA